MKTKIKKSAGEKTFDVINAIILILISLLTLYPFWYVAMASITDPVEFSAFNGIFPSGISLSSYVAVIKRQEIWQGYFNTIIYVVVGTFINIALTSLGAYALSRKNVYWKKHVMILIIITMFFSGGMIPNYLLVTGLGIKNSIWAIVLPHAVSAYNLIIMRTSFAGLPDSLEESARLDGANDFTILMRIILPTSKAIVAVMIMFYGVSNYNRWFEASLYLKDLSKYPLQLILRKILIDNAQDEMMAGTVDNREKIGLTIQYATIMVATIPIICIYPFLQKYFVKGVMIGAVKG